MKARVIVLIAFSLGVRCRCNAEVMIAGTGSAGNWTTEFLVSNPTSVPLEVSFTYFATYPGSAGCTIVECPAMFVDVPANGTKIVEFDDFPADIRLPSVLQTTYVTSNGPPPIVRARTINRLTHATSELPVADFSAVVANDSGVLVFPGAEQNEHAHVNLIVTKEFDGPQLTEDLTFEVAAYDASGSLLGSTTFALEQGDSVFPLDVLGQFGIHDLDVGSLRITKTSPAPGALWGVMAIVEDGKLPVLVTGKNL